MQVPNQYGSQYQQEVVRNANIKQSKSLCHGFVQICALKALTLELIFMKNGPRSPEIVPIIKQPGITAIGTFNPVSMEPNLRELSDQSISSPCNSAASVPKVNTATAQVTNTFHNNENVQNGFALLNSYKNNAPPIGAPKAILTPADAPAAMYCRFL
jgi:hypothetical protein